MHLFPLKFIKNNQNSKKNTQKFQTDYTIAIKRTHSSHHSKYFLVEILLFIRVVVLLENAPRLKTVMSSLKTIQLN